MMIATKGRNALKVMLDLAQHNDGTNISLADIAERVKESQKYLEAPVAQLSAAGLIISARGNWADISLQESLRSTPWRKL